MRPARPDPVRSRAIVCTVAIAAATSALAQEWRLTAPKPPPRLMAAQAYDFARGRTVLFGGMIQNFLPLGDTWEHDGSRWTRVVSANAPSPRFGAGMAYDYVRQRIVLFGGHSFSDLADTWEFDGTNWTQRFPAASPSPRSRPGMAYDLFRVRTVLHGGYSSLTSADLATTWEFDGTNWTARSTATPPPPNAGPISFDMFQGSSVMLTQATGETWLYDGQNWRRLPTQHRPTLYHFGQCYDLIGNRTVVLGGASPPNYSNDVWLFDGADWTRTTPVNGPPGRIWPGVSCNFDQRVLAFGGQEEGGSAAPMLGETWEWSQGTWRVLDKTPSPRDSARLVFDHLRDRVILAGGDQNAFDTWERIGSTWTEITTVTRPSPRTNHALAYDAARGRVTMFGGRNGTRQPTIYHGDTWVYSSTDWTQANPTASPAPRAFHAMVYDPVRRRVLLFGGFDNSWFADTWAFDGSNWSQLAPTLSPPARAGHALAYDARRDVVVLFGGAAPSGALFNDTWELDGLNWSRRTNVGAPPVRYDPTMTYDAQAGCVLMFSGYDNPSHPLFDSWHYNGVTWTQLQPNVGPPPGGPHGISCDVTRGLLVAHVAATCETWENVPARVATVARFGIGCADACGVPTLDAAPGAAPALGTQFTLRVISQCAPPAAGVLAFGFDLAQWNGAALPVDLAPIGLPGCNLWIAPDAGWLFPLAFQGSVATFTVQVPADPQLAGLVAGAQAVTLDPAGTGALTNAVVMRVF